jgi:Helicase HerA, central domain
MKGVAMPQSPPKRRSCLTLGWHVTPHMDPRYWLSPGAKAGKQIEDDLFRVSSELIGTHLAIVAQSGSGKSFFLGRLLEEILLNTKARCVILDPNADFRRVHEVESSELWSKSGYDINRRIGRLAHESSRNEFVARWAKVSKSIRINTGGNQFGEGPNYERLQLWWPSLSDEILAEDLPPMLRSDLNHCHSLVGTLGEVLGLKYFRVGEAKRQIGPGANQRGESINLIEEAQRLFRLARGLVRADFQKQLHDEFSFQEVIKSSTEQENARDSHFVRFGRILVPRNYIEQLLKRFHDRALLLSESVSPEVERYYFGRAREYEAAGILKTEVQAPWTLGGGAQTGLMWLIFLRCLRKARDTRGRGARSAVARLAGFRVQSSSISRPLGDLPRPFRD